MSKDVAWVSFDASVAELERLLMDKNASGVPVCGRDRELVGIVSKTDLIRYLAGRSADQDPSLNSDQDTAVWQIMTPQVLSAEVDDDVREVARKMLEAHVHRVLVYRDDEIVGIATSFDIMKVVAMELADSC